MCCTDTVVTLFVDIVFVCMVNLKVNTQVSIVLGDFSNESSYRYIFAILRRTLEGVTFTSKDITFRGYKSLCNVWPFVFDGS